VEFSKKVNWDTGSPILTIQLNHSGKHKILREDLSTKEELARKGHVVWIQTDLSSHPSSITYWLYNKSLPHLKGRYAYLPAQL
jgi:hypothetical protein